MSVAQAAPVLAAAGGWRRWSCLLAGGVLVADALYLMTLRVFSLGVTLPLAIGCALLALGLAWDRVQAWLQASARRRGAWRWLWRAFFAWLASVALFWVALARLAVDAPAAVEPKAILVLGSGTPGGKVSPVLASRLDVALAQAARHPQAVVVVSGGVDFNETRSEAEIMGDYLRARGLAPARIVQEERSTSTEQNFRLSAPLLRERGVSPQDPVLVVTSDFHTLRAGWIARRAGYAGAVPAGAATPLYVRYNAWLREYFAVLSGWLLREFA